MADSSIPRKPRKSNFSADEVDVLVESVRSHYNVLYGKFAKRATNRWIRQKAWLDILKKVNGVSVEKRTLQEVKNKWKKCQYVLKEKAAYGALMDEADSSWEDMDLKLIK
ncbi:Myb DNA-bind 5 domain containing protein [Asbolus verrucosus]|uniref:Regulatory protein zeste n=1 Tax=Asbolus verrucosus TaxID=1661398 RepID=A0A482VU09_ASBVE|nr:Myb DNA-bind 5 domain containing protein [Asbolus verrucosus]